MSTGCGTDTRVGLRRLHRLSPVRPPSPRPDQTQYISRHSPSTEYRNNDSQQRRPVETAQLVVSVEGQNDQYIGTRYIIHRCPELSVICAICRRALLIPSGSSGVWISLPLLKPRRR